MLYTDGVTKGLQAMYVPKIRRMLAALDAASAIEHLDAPGYRLHSLKGNLTGMWSMTVGANWRMTFRFEAPDAYDVDLIDYH